MRSGRSFYQAFYMAPIGQNKSFNDKKRVPISPIDDLDSANTNTNEVKRSLSINNAIVVRPAKLLEQGKENEDLFLAESLAAQEKLNVEDTEKDVIHDIAKPGSQFDLKYEDISCLCGVDISRKTSASTSFEETFPSNTSLKPWKSSGKGKKRKKKSGFNKKKIHKRQRVDVSMSMVNDSMKKVVLRSGTSGDACTINIHKNVDKNCAKTVGDPHKTGTKNGCVTTQTPAPAATGGLCCTVQGTRGGGGGGGGDDGEGKPPRKPPEDMLCNKISKKPKKKKKSSSSEMDVDSEDSCDEGKAPIKAPLEQEEVMMPAAQERSVILCEPVVRPTQELVLALHKAINHHTFYANRNCPCVKCKRVELMIRHQETNGSCKCAKICQLWSQVLKFHTGICKFHSCKVCQKNKKCSAGPVAVPAAAVLQNTLNVATCGQSLDEEVVWKNPELPKDLTHFREDKDYFMIKENSLVGKGAHGTVHNVEVVEHTKKKYFSSCSNDFVLKETKSVDEDEKYVLEQTAKHPHFVKTYLVVKNSMHCRIFMEKCQKSLKDYLCQLVQEGKQMEMHEAMFYWTQIVQATHYLHHLRIPVIHKDIKAENVLLDVKDKFVRAKLTDYDTVKMLHNDFTQPGLMAKGTPGLISPEVLRGYAHGRPADMWNVAMFLLQILFPIDFMKLQLSIKALKSPAPYLLKTEELIQKFLQKAVPNLKKMDHNVADLIERCLKENHEQRPTAEDVLKHPAVVKYMNMKMNMVELAGKICPKKNCATR